MFEPYQLIARQVKGMHKECSLTMNSGRRCGNSAVWAVQTKENFFLWRCEAHKSVVEILPNGGYTEGNWTDTVLVSLEHWRH